jgi:hypothetical protein
LDRGPYLPQTAPRAAKKGGAPRRSPRKKDQAVQQVEALFAEAEEQLRRYLAEPRLEAVQGPGGWKAYSVVQVGTKGLFYRELGQPTIRLRG